MLLNGAPTVLANARSASGFGRSAGFLNAIAAARQEIRKPAQHVMGAAPGGFPGVMGGLAASPSKPLRSGPWTA